MSLDASQPKYDPNSIYPAFTTQPPHPSNILVQNTHEINDMRSMTDFKGYSFSNYKKCDAKKQLIDALLNRKLEAACYWTAELICAGHLSEIWEIILYYMAKHIHIGNPKMAVYLQMRYNVFRNIMNKGNINSDLDVRNDEECRKLFAEIMITMSISPRKMSFEGIKINKQHDFDMTYMKERLNAPSMIYAESVFRQKDPKEIFIALNEFAYYISKDGYNMTSACYWYEWLIEFDASCKIRKQQCICEPREHSVENKYRCDVIWVLWDALFYYSKLLKNPLIEKALQSLLSLFCIRYTNACGKRRKYMIYYAISLLTETVPLNIEIVQDRALLQTCISKTHLIYKQIKKNEQTPSTDYLFQNIDKKFALEKSMRQMEMINSMDMFQS